MTVPTVEQKQCSKCHVMKNAVDFFRREQSHDGLQSWCRSCKNAARQGAMPMGSVHQTVSGGAYPGMADVTLTVSGQSLLPLSLPVRVAAVFPRKTASTRSWQMCRRCLGSGREAGYVADAAGGPSAGAGFLAEYDERSEEAQDREEQEMAAGGPDLNEQELERQRAEQVAYAQAAQAHYDLHQEMQGAQDAEQPVAASDAQLHLPPPAHPLGSTLQQSTVLLLPELPSQLQAPQATTDAEIADQLQIT